MTKDILENDPYKKAGVDIEAGDLLVKKIKKIVKRTHINGVLGGIGGFAGMFELSKSYKNPVLVACTDGVGTKVNLAAQNNNLNIIGQDLVAMCVNDMITCGASPLFFLDYYGTSKLKIDEAAIIIESISNACIESNCALLGGETAEMPNHYKDKNFDLAGFSVGCVDKDKIIDGSDISEDDDLIGINSSGPHSNGYSLIRKIIDESNEEDNQKKEIIAQALKPTILYPKLITNILDEFKLNGMAHITGGGITENVPRIIPKNLSVEIYKNSWEIPNIFRWLQINGKISDDSLLRIFNCGIGMVLIVNKSITSNVVKFINSQNFKAYKIGKIKVKKDNYNLIYK